MNLNTMMMINMAKSKVVIEHNMSMEILNHVRKVRQFLNMITRTSDQSDLCLVSMNDEVLCRVSRETMVMICGG